MSTLLGPIVRLQLQRKPLKTPKVGYDPTPLLPVDEAFVGPGGITATVDGSRVIDANHDESPTSSGRRALSMGFTDHYARMTERFGKAPLGCAGENVVVATDRRVHLDDLAGTVMIRTSDGDLPLTGAFVAAPCLEFTSYLLGRDTVGSVEEIGEDRMFLHEGIRGYILGVKHLDREWRVRVGDEVWVEET